MMTTQAPTTQVYQVFIKVTPERIWDAITKPEFTAKYFHGARVETEGGVRASFRYHSADGASLWGDETIFEWDPPRRLSVSWRSLYDPDLADEEPSRVTWEIEPQEGRLLEAHGRPRPAGGRAEDRRERVRPRPG